MFHKYHRKWDALSIHYMSEEEDGPDGVVFVKNFRGVLIVSIIVFPCNIVDKIYIYYT